MSSSDPKRPIVPPTAWALDELEMPDIFVPLSHPQRRRSDSAQPSEQEETASPQERARIEAAAYARGRADGEKLAQTELLPMLTSAADALLEALENVELHQARWTANAEEN